MFFFSFQNIEDSSYVNFYTTSRRSSLVDLDPNDKILSIAQKSKENTMLSIKKTNLSKIDEAKCKIKQGELYNLAFF